MLSHAINKRPAAGEFRSQEERGAHISSIIPDTAMHDAGQSAVNALEEDAFDRQKCWDRLNDNYRTLDYFSDLPGSTDVCGKCAAMLPCSFANPVNNP